MIQLTASLSGEEMLPTWLTSSISSGDVAFHGADMLN
jgi:hypothetical protein